MKHYGDIAKINGHDVPIVDCIVGGSPCQGLSCAGKRLGLADDRSGLFMEQIRIIKEQRDESKRRSDKHIRPRFAVWENVAGAFSSGTPKGEDFRIVLEEFCRIADPSVSVPRPADGKWQPAGEIVGDGWSVAWRTHDAQYWGVAQRRRRISVVADFATAYAGELLFERVLAVGDGLQGNHPQSRGERKAAAEDPAGGVGDDDSCSWDGGQISPTLTANNAGGNQRMPDKDNFNCVINAVGIGRDAYNSGANAKFGMSVEDEPQPPMTAKGPGAVAHRVFKQTAIRYIARRLTPVECERLQGFPDGWTDIGEWTDSKGKKRKSANALRYKALGNSIALPFWRWLMRRISAEYVQPPTMASLFDGIGGFPLIWQSINGDGTAVWASEIDEFPMAVTKFHFGEE